jgi:hypothetical protein
LSTPLDHEFVRAVAGAADRPAAPPAAGRDAVHRGLAFHQRERVCTQDNPG